MTTKTLSTYVAAGYTLASQYDTLDITATGGVGGTGVVLNHLATLDNLGNIKGAGGANGVHLTAGGTIVNGSTSVTTASISGYSGVFAQNAAPSVSNYGTIKGLGRFGDGVFLTAGGQVTNGAASDITAYIQGDNSGIAVGGAAATVTNFGTISAVYSNGVDLALGGAVTNGSASDTAARIRADRGWAIASETAPATIANFGFISGALTSNVDGGVDLEAGGALANGSAKDVTAKIVAYRIGVYVKSGATTVSNFGTIEANAGAAVYFEGDGVAAASILVNGGANDASALLLGNSAGVAFDRYGTVSNFGTIEAVGQSQSSAGVSIARSGTVTNGSAADTRATIEGYDGVLVGAGFVSNFGTVTGVGASYGDGVILFNGGGVTNGSADDTTALIEGTHRGVLVENYALNATVTNWGTISGAGASAVDLLNASDTLIVEAGCVFVGAVLGDGGTLDLDTGAGTLTGNLASGTVTVSGSMAPTPFQDFDTVEIGAAASFATSGAMSLAAGQRVIVSGSLTIGAKKFANGGTIETVGGTVTVKGKVTGSGRAIVEAGLLDFTGAFNQDVTFVGGVGTLELAESQSYGGAIAGFSKSGGTFLDLSDIGFSKSTTATYSGTKTGGVLTVTDGTHTAQIDLVGDYRASTFVAASDGHGGTLVHDPAAPPAAIPSPHRLIAAMAGMGADGAGPGHAAVEPWRRDAQSLAKPA